MQLLSAVFKATNAAVNDALQTPNVHSEIVAYLSSSKNVHILPACVTNFGIDFPEFYGAN